MTLHSEFEADVQELHPHVPLHVFVYSVHISLKHRYVFVETPKCACTTIKLALQRLELQDRSLVRPNNEMVHVRDFSPLLDPRQVYRFSRFLKAGDVTKVCFVRNPYDRLVSAYVDKIAGNKSQKAEILRHLGLPENRLDAEVTFDQFVGAVAEQPVAAMNPHWRTQYHQTFQSAVPYTMVGKVESLAADMARFGELIGADLAFYVPTHRYNATGGHEGARDWFDADLRRKVLRAFEIDFEHFGYDSRVP
jgi:hypothetical protein